jgi:hypothetical protein
MVNCRILHFHLSTSELHDRPTQRNKPELILSERQLKEAKNFLIMFDVVREKRGISPSAGGKNFE